jgi:hypothetical protein
MIDAGPNRSHETWVIVPVGGNAGGYGLLFALRSPRTPFLASNGHLYEYATNHALAGMLHTNYDC